MMNCRLIPSKARRYLCVAVLSLPGLVGGSVLPGNFWPNPSLELDSNGDGIPDFWNKGGSDQSGISWTTSTSVSPTHSLTSSDTNAAAFGEWYSDFLTVTPGASYSFRFFRRYSTQDGPMRLTLLFRNASDATVSSVSFSVNGDQVGWEQIDSTIEVPATAVKLRINIASGGAVGVTGFLGIDDISLSEKPASIPGRIARVNLMPEIPSPFEIRNWKAVALGYDELVFDFAVSGEYLPLIERDHRMVNFDLDSFLLPSFVGKVPAQGEAINQIAAVLGATLVGIDKSNQDGENWVLPLLQYFNHTNGKDLVLNNVNVGATNTFWYALFPQILFYALVDQYPATAAITVPYSQDSGGASMLDVMQISAQRWYDASVAMGGGINPPDYNWTGFDFSTMTPVYTNHLEPEAAAGIAWIEYMAYLKFGSPQFLQGAEWGMEYLNNRSDNPFYEVLLPFGAYLAARMNAERGTSYDVQKIVEWCFDGDSAARPGWGVLAQAWAGLDVHGLQGSVTGDYPFAMNTFAMAGALVPMVRYDQHFADSIGKWMLHVANNARLFYGPFHDAAHQSSASWLGDPNGYISYEGLRKNWEGVSPYATGDQIRNGRGPTDLALYGASHVGVLGGIISPTSDPKVLQLDLLKTDFFGSDAHPTYLYYNPEAAAKQVQVDIGPVARDIYDLRIGQFTRHNISGTVTLDLGPQAAAVLVFPPANATVGASGNQLFASGRIIDYRQQSVDADLDDLPDWWETFYYGHATTAEGSAVAANQFTNLENYLLGTDPNDFEQRFHIRNSGVSAEKHPWVQWNSVGGQTYAVEYSVTPSNFAEKATINVTDVPVGVTTTSTFVDEDVNIGGATATERGFYRVRHVPSLP